MSFKKRVMIGTVKDYSKIIKESTDIETFKVFLKKYYKKEYGCNLLEDEINYLNFNIYTLERILKLIIT